MPASFLLLEITDPVVNALLWSMRDRVSGRRPRAAIHLTVRGPYEGEPPTEMLDRWKKVLSGEVLRIHGAGRFSNPDGEVVFVRVDSPRLRDIWWKPTFRNYEPHISIYRGSDKGLADVVETFLTDARLDIPCAEYRLVWHRSGQRDLFDANVPDLFAMEMFSQAERVDPDILDQLSEALDKHRKKLAASRDKTSASSD